MTPDEHQSIANVYELLSRLWLREVDVELLDAIVASPLADELNVNAERASQTDLLNELATQYCALFIGPKDHLPPYQSVWQTGQLQSETTDSVRAYTEALRAADLIGQSEMADHLGHQMLVMSEIHRRLAKTDDNNLRDLGHEFFRTHLNWASPLIQAANDRTCSNFYQKVVALSGELLAAELISWTRPDDA